MKTKITLAYRLTILICFIASLVIPAVPAQPVLANFTSVNTARTDSLPSPVIDGVVDVSYGLPLASDSSGDGNGNNNMDLLELYITEDIDYFYIAFSINADIGSTNWGKYILYIDTTNDTNGATSDAWTRNVIVNDPHKPEFSINSWVDAPPYSTEDIQLWVWDQDTASWSSPGSIQAAALGTGVTSVFEWQVAKSALGNPDTIWAEVWDTGGGGTDNAQDTINDPADDWNATDWSTQAVLDNSTEYLQRQAPIEAENGCQSGALHDDVVWWSDLGHNSRDMLYRVPSGSVTTGTPVTLRLRTTCNDLTAVKARVWNDYLDTQSIFDLTLVASDELYDWWEVTLPASSDPTVYWYRFLAIDGTDIDYYEDDYTHLGGWGQVFDESVDNSWQLTIYDPAYQTPDWVKNAVIYQIFPDRFRDGEVSNDTPPDSFFYGEDSTIYRSNTTDWNQVICDPRDPTGDCPQIWSQNFYGGDLQGVIDNLDYLQGLGVTAIYFNPIFESPSNHKYDTTNYSLIDDNFGDLELFEELVTEANTRGINLILDGVFNHTSSDSIYFDRYSRYDSIGACEDPDSPYRDWYFFQDVTPGSGSCVGSDGTPNAATYTSWFGYDSLPKLNSSNAEVRQLIWDDGSSSIAPYWVLDGRADGWRLDVGSDVDPGTLTDPTNDYWEGFRSAVRAANPEGYITGEEWGYGTSWLLGTEWDGVMNYQFSSAVLSFWRDEEFVDNDHNPGSSAGSLAPITPSQLDERLKNLQERYPEQAFYAMMNLLGSHDTNRALFMLDHRTDENNPSIYQNTDYDWSDAITRLKGVVILQMTLPGAPTIYYGDEVGLVGPVAYDDVYDKWEDDPYNRQPYPWLDETGTPYYTHLQSEAGQDVLLDHYTLLANTRNAHPALRTGSFDTLLVDDTNMVYAYGRKLLTPQDAAVVAINRLASPQTISLNVSGYLPTGAVLADVLNGDIEYTVQPDGSLSIPDVQGMFGAVLVLVSGDLTPPDAPTNLTAVEGDDLVDLSWISASGADSYNLYRSLFSGGGYSLLVNTTDTYFTDSDVVNGNTYYYIVRSLNSVGLESDDSNEASAMPHYTIDSAHLQWPEEITHTIGLTPTENIYGQVFIDGVTVLPGATPGLLAQVGFGLTDTEPADWDWWVDAVFNEDKAGGLEEWMGSLIPETLGEYAYVYRFSTTDGRDWVYADLDGIFTGAPTSPGILNVLPSDDTLAPDTPQNLALTDWGADFLELRWDPIQDDPSLYAYDLFRSETSGEVGNKIARILSPTTVFTDTSVTTGVTYYYIVQAVDSSFNRSGYSNQVSGVPQAKYVDVTFQVTVPDFTPGTVYIVGDQPELGNWDPAAVPMTETLSNTWTITRTFLDGQQIQFKFARGNWETVEKAPDGNVEIANRELTADYGTDGQQVVDLTVANWRDPIVVSFSPLEGVTNVPLVTTISVTWSQSMTVDSSFDVTSPIGPVAGTFSYDDPSWTVTFTPDQPLKPSTIYAVSIQDQVDFGNDTQQVPVSWLFQTAGDLPTVQFALAAYSIDESAGTLAVTATLSSPTLETVTVDFAASDVTAVGGEDYVPITGTLTFEPQQVEQTITLDILDDEVEETDETFVIDLNNPQNAVLGDASTTTIAILDDELPAVQFASATYSTDEDAGVLIVTVTLSTLSLDTVTVDFTTSDGSAVGNQDYTPISGIVTFAPQQMERTITISILDDTADELNEIFLVILSNPQNAILGDTFSTAITIIDDDQEGIFMISLPVIYKY